MTCSPRSNDKSKDNQNNNNNNNNNCKFLNLMRKDDRDMPKKQNLAALVIVATSKSTSAQIDYHSVTQTRKYSHMIVLKDVKEI